MKKWQKTALKATALGVLVGLTHYLGTTYLPSWASYPIIVVGTGLYGFLFMKWRD